MICPKGIMETIKPSRPWADKSSFHMIDVGSKEVTRRRAIAQGKVILTQSSYTALERHENPKGDVLALAEVAGILSAKKTSELIPLCHPIPIDQISLGFELIPARLTVLVRCEVMTSAKTGVEMEALCGLNGALLCIYDLCKAVDPEITITDVRLELKEGGKSGLWRHPQADSGQTPQIGELANRRLNRTLEGIRATVITVSDRISAGKAEDQSGPTAAAILKEMGCASVDCLIVADEMQDIQATVMNCVGDLGQELVILTGGTGLSPRDFTPEAIEEICDRVIPGIGERLRSAGAAHTAMTWLSRSMGGQVGKSLLIALPGSPSAVEQGLSALADVLPHALHIVNGGNHG